VSFDVTDKILITYPSLMRYTKTMGLYSKYWKTTVNREILYDILIDYDIATELVRLIKICSDETYRKVHIGNGYLAEPFPIQNCLKQGDALPPLLFNLALGYFIRKAYEKQKRLERDIIFSFMPMTLTSWPKWISREEKIWCFIRHLQGDWSRRKRRENKIYIHVSSLECLTKS